MRSFLALCITFLSAAPLAAEDLTLRPQSCVRAATVQYDNCSIANIFKCTGQPAAFWIETLDSDNILTIETRNADHGSMTIAFVGQDISMKLTQTKAHPRDTIRIGSATDTVEGEMEIFGMKRPLSGRTSYGYAGETIVLAGETFGRIAFQGGIALPPPMPEMTGGGTFLYSDRLDLLIEEAVTIDAGTGLDGHNLSKLSLPGQAGFGDETPGYGCGELSKLDLGGEEVPA